MKKIKHLLAFSLLGLLAYGCNEAEDNNNNGPQMPSTYSFENVNYQGQTERLDMLAELTAYMKNANNITSTTKVEYQKMLDMYGNTNNPFSSANLNASTKDLLTKTASNAIVDSVKGWMQDFATAHAGNETTTGSNGQAGVVTSTNGQKAYFCDANGVEHIQFIEKGIMGCVFYYQTASVYTSASKIGPSVDNETVVPGEGTDKQHHWDEAFGYFGVPNEFPDSTAGARFHGKYCVARDALLGLNEKIMNEGFIKGRFAIDTKNEQLLNEAVNGVRKNYELVVAATAVHYLNKGIADFTDDALRNHVLSEAYAFIWSLRFNPDATITPAQVDGYLSELGTNYYNVSSTGLTTLRDKLAAHWSEINAVKAQL